MQISSRFAIAVHVLTCIMTFSKDRKVTSDFIAGSTGVNPVIIRRILLQLSAAGIVQVKRGSGGAVIAKPLDEITLLDVYRATDSVEGKLFSFHENPNPLCPVGRNIHSILDKHLEDAEEALEASLSAVKLSDIDREAKERIG